VFFVSSKGHSPKRHYIQVIELTCISNISKERNSRIFCNKEMSHEHLLDPVKLFSCQLLKV